MPKYDLVIRGGLVVRERGVEKLDVAAADGKFVALAAELPGDARETIDAAGLHVFPGVIDPHVHFNEPGRTDWEGISTGSAAFAGGGGTLFFDMPLNSSPPVLDGESFDQKLAAMRAKSLTDFGLWGGLTPNNLDTLDELAARGVVGFKAFMADSGIDDFARADDETLLRGMERAAEYDRVVAVHAESEKMTAAATRAARAAGRTDARAYLDSRPVAAEVVAIERACALARQAGCRLHVVHVSSPSGVEAVREAQRRGADVTCETCPHYLTLTDDDVCRLGTVAKCAPPVRSAAERRALLEDLFSGRIDLVASNHSPSPPSMKTSDDFFAAWGGIAGVQSTLPLMLAAPPPGFGDVAAPLATLLAGNAARIFRIPDKGAVEIGYDADFALVDRADAYVLRSADLHTRHKISPYVGRTLRGRVRRTIVRGRTVFLDGKVISEPLGQLVTPE